MARLLPAFTACQGHAVSTTHHADCVQVVLLPHALLDCVTWLLRVRQCLQQSPKMPHATCALAKYSCKHVQPASDLLCFLGCFLACMSWHGCNSPVLLETQTTAVSPLQACAHLLTSEPAFLPRQQL